MHNVEPFNLAAQSALHPRTASKIAIFHVHFVTFTASTFQLYHCQEPIIGIAFCCARAASGHAAAPPRSATNSGHLISSIGFLRTELSKFGRSQPLCARLKGYHPEGATDRLLHCGMSAPSANGFIAETGHKQRTRPARSRTYVRSSPGSCRKSGCQEIWRISAVSAPTEMT